MLADQKLLDTIRSTDLCDELDHFRIPVSAITTNDEERAFDTFGNGEEDGCDEGLGIVWLLEDSDFLTKS